MDRTIKSEMYKKATRAYEFHVSRYKDWMYMYAIFVGAFFVGYCTDAIQGNTFLQLVVTIMGLITSLCWLTAFQGYYSWMISWIKILHFHEGQILEAYKKDYQELDNKLRVYSMIFEGDVKDTGYSTQKVTKFFILAVIIAWTFLLISVILNPSKIIYICVEMFEFFEIREEVILIGIVQIILSILIFIIVGFAIKKILKMKKKIIKEIKIKGRDQAIRDAIKFNFKSDISAIHLIKNKAEVPQGDKIEKHYYVDTPSIKTIIDK